MVVIKKVKKNNKNETKIRIVKKPKNKTGDKVAPEEGPLFEGITTEDTLTQDASGGIATQDASEGITTQDASEGTATQNASESTATQNASKSTATHNASESTATQDASESTATQNASESTATQNASESTATQDASEGIATQSASNSIITQSASKGIATEGTVIQGDAEGGAAKDTITKSAVTESTVTGGVITESTVAELVPVVDTPKKSRGPVVIVASKLNTDLNEINADSNAQITGANNKTQVVGGTSGTIDSGHIVGVKEEGPNTTPSSAIDTTKDSILVPSEEEKSVSDIIKEDNAFNGLNKSQDNTTVGETRDNFNVQPVVAQKDLDSVVELLPTSISASSIPPTLTSTVPPPTATLGDFIATFPAAALAMNNTVSTPLNGTVDPLIHHEGPESEGAAQPNDVGQIAGTAFDTPVLEIEPVYPGNGGEQTIDSGIVDPTQDSTAENVLDLTDQTNGSDNDSIVDIVFDKLGRRIIRKKFRKFKEGINSVLSDVTDTPDMTSGSEPSGRSPVDVFPQFPTDVDFMLELVGKSVNRISKTCTDGNMIMQI